ncbi:MAG: phosphatidate cytidylyltransferase [Bacteroidetes bacterium]|nr:phosphatidate cytidylyltransferase [Bacteroidota bacterium]
MSELKKRIIVALIGIPLGLLAIYIGGLVFSVLILIISSIALYEFYKITLKQNYKINIILGTIIGTIPILVLIITGSSKCTLFQYITSYLPLFAMAIIYLYLIYIIAISIIIILIYFLFNKKEDILLRIGIFFAGFFYISIPFFILVLLRNLDNGFFYTILTFISIWICDSGAYFIGRRFGKHKLMPSVSPKKTIEGAIAGFILSSLFFIITSMLLIENMSLLLSILIGITIGIFGQLGDLVESKIKRIVEVKDSSNLIPGHGGILDRFDSIIFVVPLIYAIIMLY